MRTHVIAFDYVGPTLEPIANRGGAIVPIEEAIGEDLIDDRVAPGEIGIRCAGSDP